MLLISVFQAKIYNIQRTKIIIYNQIKETFCKYLLALLVLHTLYPTSVKVFRGFLFSTHIRHSQSNIIGPDEGLAQA